MTTTISPETIAACTGDATTCPNHYTGGDYCCEVSEARSGRYCDNPDCPRYCRPLEDDCGCEWCGCYPDTEVRAMKPKQVTVYHCPEGIGGGASAHGPSGWYYDLADEDGLGDYGVGPFHTSLAARYAATVIAEKAEQAGISQPV